MKAVLAQAIIKKRSVNGNRQIGNLTNVDFYFSPCYFNKSQGRHQQHQTTHTQVYPKIRTAHFATK